jgi:hypothetical protein
MIKECYHCGKKFDARFDHYRYCKACYKKFISGNIWDTHRRRFEEIFRSRINSKGVVNERR